MQNFEELIYIPELNTRDFGTYYYKHDNKLANGVFYKVNTNSTHYFLNGKYHRVDGPAYISNYGNEYYYFGTYVNAKDDEDFKRQARFLCLK